MKDFSVLLRLFYSFTRPRSQRQRYPQTLSNATGATPANTMQPPYVRPATLRFNFGGSNLRRSLKSKRPRSVQRSWQWSWETWLILTEINKKEAIELQASKTTWNALRAKTVVERVVGLATVLPAYLAHVGIRHVIVDFRIDEQCCAMAVVLTPHSSMT